MKKCLNCAELNADSVGFCVNCGSSDFENVASVVCPNCKSEAKAGFDFCIECGTKLPHTSVAEQQRKNLAINFEGFDCPHCGNTIPIASVFCPHCGNEVNNFNTNRKVKKLVCPNCGTQNDINSKCCSYCFFGLEDAKVQEMTITVKPKTCVGGQIMQCVLVSEDDSHGKVICPSCQALNLTESEYCLKCGQTLLQDIPKKYCFVCGSENSVNAKFCINCKYQFDSQNQHNSSWTCECGCENEKDSDFCIYCGKSKYGSLELSTKPVPKSGGSK